MFTEKCFIRKNSQELVNKLVEIGHNVISFSEHRYIVCDKNNVYLTSTLPDKDIDEYICCDTNEELFLVIASIRNDKPDYQWFVWDDAEEAYDNDWYIDNDTLFENLINKGYITSLDELNEFISRYDS